MRPADLRHRLIEQRLQDVPLSEFQDLRENDVLFVDSTHVAKLGSDVLRIFFEILPGLAPGVYVHVHDIFWPFEYPEPWIAEGRAWTETYLLRAFLQFNSAFRIVLFSDLVFATTPGVGCATCPELFSQRWRMHLAEALQLATASPSSLHRWEPLAERHLGCQRR